MRARSPQRCLRCGGLLHPEWVPGELDHGPLWLWACFACGDRIDAVILRHRRLPPASRRPAGRWARLWRSIQTAVATCRKKRAAA